MMTYDISNQMDSHMDMLADIEAQEERQNKERLERALTEPYILAQLVELSDSFDEYDELFILLYNNPEKGKAVVEQIVGEWVIEHGDQVGWG